MQLPESDGADGVGYGVDYPIFWIDRFHPHGVRQHTAFAARNRATVDAFHAAALEAGGTDNGAPGLRDPAQGYPPGYYAAFVLDRLYEAYSFSMLPWLGTWVAGDADAYRYLAESIRRFPDQATFARMIEGAGLERVSFRNLSGGIATLHSAWRL